MPYFKYMSAFHLFFTSAPSLPAWFLQFSISIHSLVVLSHFSTQIIHIIIIITQHVDTPVMVWGVEWQVFVSRDRGHWPARALSCPLEGAQLTGPSGTTTLQPFIMNQDTARSPELTTIPIIAIMPRIHHPRVPDSGQSSLAGGGRPDAVDWSARPGFSREIFKKKKRRRPKRNF